MKASDAEQGAHDVDVPYPWPRGKVTGTNRERRARAFWIVLSVVLFAVLVAVVTMMATLRW